MTPDYLKYFLWCGDKGLKVVPVRSVSKWHLPLAYARLAFDGVDHWVRNVPLVDLAVGLVAVAVAYEAWLWDWDVSWWVARHFGGAW